MKPINKTPTTAPNPHTVLLICRLAFSENRLIGLSEKKWASAKKAPQMAIPVMAATTNKENVKLSRRCDRKIRLSPVEASAKPNNPRTIKESPPLFSDRYGAGSYE